MEDFELVGPNGTDVNNEFLKQYRDALRNQYDANVSSLRQQKRNSDASIMSAANESGMMYSNFPQRSKIQAESEYLSNLSNLHNTYQTGLDKLRSNAVNAYNQIKAYEEAIADLDEATSKNNSGSASGTGNSSTAISNLLGSNQTLGGSDGSVTNFKDLAADTSSTTKSGKNTSSNTAESATSHNLKTLGGAMAGSALLGPVVQGVTSWLPGMNLLGPLGSATLGGLGGAYLVNHSK